MKRYIDCDGVILNTEEGLFDRYHEIKKQNPSYKRGQYLAELDWEFWINQAQVINDAINILNSHDPNAADILTKVHSLREARIKIDYFRKKKVKNNIIIVPSDVSKASVVSANGNILVDDSVTNLIDWENENGIPISFGSCESFYPKIETLEDIFDDEKVKKIIFR